MARTAIPWVLLAAVVCAAIAPSMSSADKARDADYRRAEVLAEVRRWMTDNHVEPVDGESLFQGALRGMAESLDPHSTLLSPEELAALTEDASGAFGGVGVSLKPQDGALELTALVPGGPAEEAGLAPGDRIVSIDGSPVSGVHPDRAAARLRGRPGTMVKVTATRGRESIEFLIERRTIAARSVTAQGHIGEGQDIGYVRVECFQQTTPSELRIAVSTLADGGAKALIIDLRGNPGGSLDAAVSAADMFVRDGPLLSTRGRAADSCADVSASPDAPFSRLAIAVLVDRGTASAAEALASVLRARCRATMVGGRTFGKNTVQSILKLEGGSALKMTTARFLITGSGVFGSDGSQFGGIEPDIASDAPATFTAGAVPSDQCVAAAEAALRGKIR